MLQLVASALIEPTKPIVVPGPGPDRDLSCIFEDDGVAGYFYALDLTKTDNRILDAVMIYSYTESNPKEVQTELKILWKEGRDRCVLSLDGHPYALFDFETKTGYNVTGYPDAQPEKGWSRVGSTDPIIGLLRE